MAQPVILATWKAEAAWSQIQDQLQQLGEAYSNLDLVPE